MTIPSIISILFTLGSQPDCEGYGLCTLEAVTEVSTESCQKTENCILADLDYVDHALVLTVSESKLKDKVFIRYFTKEYFELEKDFYIYNELADQLGAPANTIIPKGKYLISEDRGKIVVRFEQ